MNTLTLQWQEGNKNITQHISPEQPSKNPGSIRIGRDPQQCDIVLTPNSVSRLHAEILFDAKQQTFYIRNYSAKSPTRVDDKLIKTGEITSLNTGNIIFLGEQQLQVLNVNIIANIPSSKNPVYALQCSKCGKVLPREKEKQMCDGCGKSLVDAMSVLVFAAKKY